MLIQDPLSEDSRHFAFVSRSALTLLQTYIQEAYPKQQKQGKETKDCAELAEAVYHAQTMLRRILSSRKSQPVPRADRREGKRKEQPMETVLEACCSAFRACFRAFYPTTPLKWLALCQHLQLLDPVRCGLSGI